MPRIFTRTKTARRDIVEAWEYIARDNPKAADTFINQLESRFNLLTEFPHLGRERNEIADGLRSFPFGNFAIIYRITDSEIRLLRVIRSSRDIAALL